VKDKAMPDDELPPDATLKAIRIQFNIQHLHEPAEAQRERALAVLAAALLVIQNGASRAWTIQEALGEPLSYDVMPLSDQSVPIDDVWVMVYALRDQPQIAAAEPLFRA
jgi:hypothetical protein